MAFAIRCRKLRALGSCLQPLAGKPWTGLGCQVQLAQLDAGVGGRAVPADGFGVAVPNGLQSRLRAR